MSVLLQAGQLSACIAMMRFGRSFFGLSFRREHAFLTALLDRRRTLSLW
jgi:hypothetical protein